MNYDLDTMLIKKSYNKNKELDVLIVDDDKESVESMKDLLEISGHNVTIVDEEARCITLCSNTTYDLIIMDYHMQDVDGDKIIEIIKEDNVKSTIFAFTGDKTNNALDTFKKLNINGIIYKPITPDNFLELINMLSKKVNPDISSLKEISNRSNGEIIVFDK
jgi:CheY-like chemotaxis protein